MWPFFESLGIFIEALIKPALYRRTLAQRYFDIERAV